jgi:hypothetical protein
MTIELLSAAEIAVHSGREGVVYQVKDGDGTLYKWNPETKTMQAVGAGEGTGDVTGPESSVDNELALFSGTGGKTIKRASTTGLLKATSGVVAAAVAGTDYVTPTGAETLSNKTLTAPTLNGMTFGGGLTVSAAAMGADAIDVTKLGNTKTLTADTTLTFSATPTDRTEFACELIGHSAAVTVTIPSSRRIDTNEDITSFVMPANGYAVLTWRRKGSVNLVSGVPGMKVMIPFAILAPEDGDYTIILKSIWAGAITDLTAKSASGTCTLTGKINSTNLGGTANSVSSTESSQSHSSANVVAVGDDIVLTVSANTSASKVSGRFEMTVY